MKEIESILRKHFVEDCVLEYAKCVKDIEQYVQEEIRKAVEMEADCHERD